MYGNGILAKDSQKLFVGRSNNGLLKRQFAEKSHIFNVTFLSICRPAVFQKVFDWE